MDDEDDVNDVDDDDDDVMGLEWLSSPQLHDQPKVITKKW